MIFHFEHLRASRSFRGSSQLFGIALGLSGIAGVITMLAYLGIYGWNVSWIGAIVALVLGMVAAGVLGGMLSAIIGSLGMMLVGFIAWPVCAYLMFTLLP